MSPTTINELIEAARLHFQHARADITNASTRIEHIRLTQLAQEAENLLTNLEKFAAEGILPGDLQLDPVPTSNERLCGCVSAAGAAVSCACTR